MRLASLSVIGALCVAATVAGCGGNSEKTAALEAQLLRENALLGRAAVENVHEDCKPGEVRLTLSRHSESSDECISTREAAAVERFLRAYTLSGR